MGADSPLETLQRLCELIPNASSTAPVTYVGSSVSDLLAAAPASART